MAGQDFSLRIRNITPFDANVKLLYTGDDPNWNVPYLDAFGVPQTPSGTNYSPINGERIGFNFVDKVFKNNATNPNIWGPLAVNTETLQNPDGTVWVDDGNSIPTKFSLAFNYTANFIYGANLFTHTVNVTPGRTIDSVLRESSEGIRDLLITFGIASDVAQLLGNATPLGAQIIYEINAVGLKELVIRLETCNNQAGNPGSFQTITIGATTITLNAVGSRFGYNIQEDGWTKWIDVTDRSGDGLAYIELVNSLANQSLFTNEVYKYSNSSFQLNETLLWKKYDATGNDFIMPDTGLLDPYQPQQVNTVYPNILVDGEVYVELKSLAGEFLDLTFYYDTAGVLNHEQIETLEKILREENMNNMFESEEEELNKIYKDASQNVTQKYSNFSGDISLSNKNKYTIGFLALGLAIIGYVGKK